MQLHKALFQVVLPQIIQQLCFPFRNINTSVFEINSYSQFPCKVGILHIKSEETISIIPKGRMNQYSLAEENQGREHG